MQQDRRDFLNIFRKPLSNKKENFIIRPPYALKESTFEQSCINCSDNKCASACPENIITIAVNKLPTLNFTNSGCTFCQDCANACEYEVLSLEHTKFSEKLNAVFDISLEKCIAHNGVICSSCKDPCLDDAILFNGMFNPVIDMEKCTACGFCISRCPTDAINFTPYLIKENTL